MLATPQKVLHEGVYNIRHIREAHIICPVERAERAKSFNNLFFRGEMWPFLPPLSPFTTTIWIFYWLVHSVGHGCLNWIIGWIEPKYFCRTSVACSNWKKLIKNWQNIKKNLIYILQMEILRKDQKTRVVTISGTRVRVPATASITSGAYWQARDMILEFHFDSRWAQRDDGFVDWGRWWPIWPLEDLWGQPYKG